MEFVSDLEWPRDSRVESTVVPLARDWIIDDIGRDCGFSTMLTEQNHQNVFYLLD